MCPQHSRGCLLISADLLICASLKGWRRSATNLSRAKKQHEKKTPKKWSSVFGLETK